VASRFWTATALLAQVGGVAAGVLKGLGTLDVDLLSLAAAFAAAVLAWTRARDHAALAETFGVLTKRLRGGRALLRSGTGPATLTIERVESALADEQRGWLRRREELGLSVE
jgi:hypothetical protein